MSSRAFVHPCTIEQFLLGFLYYAQTKTNGFITSADWTFDRDELAKLFNNNTKGIVLNNPHNPTGKVFTMEEVQFIADLAIKYDAVVIADEVYEWLIYEPEVKHVRIGTYIYRTQSSECH